MSQNILLHHLDKVKLLAAEINAEHALAMQHADQAVGYDHLRHREAA
ncbi:MAG: hypothetical protein WB870_06875 [Gallionellaceae bacterium]